jgi:hypothetical protein
VREEKGVAEKRGKRKTGVREINEYALDYTSTDTNNNATVSPIHLPFALGRRLFPCPQCGCHLHGW